MGVWNRLVFLLSFASLLYLCKCDYSNVGGPLAKSARKPVPSKTRTTAFPDVDEGEPSFQAPGAKINAAVVNNKATVPPSAVDKPQMFKPGPGEYSDMCCWEPYKGQTLTDVSQGRITKPFYGYVGSESCTDIGSCLAKCKKETCNYAVFFSTNNSATMYAVHKEKLGALQLTPGDLSQSNFSQTAGSDSYVRRCLREYDLSPGCTELMATQCPLCDEFFDFVIKYNKTYKGCEFIRRFEIFKLNKRKIANFNNQRVLEEDASFAVNQFADYTHDEFVKLYTGAKPEEPPTRLKREATIPPGLKPMTDPVLNASGAATLPLRHNWADFNVIPPVRDQKDCGSCYAFTSTDLVAAQYSIDHDIKQAFTLAPQYILDCFTEPAAYGCDGGRPWLVLNQLSKCISNPDENACMFPLESCLPYRNNATKQCDKPRDCPGAPKIQVRQHNMLQTNDFLEKQKMAGLLNRGPLVVQIDASEQWQFYEEGVLRAYQCTNTTNHAVLMVGYDFGTAIPGYIIRNTWGTDWGQKGFIYIEAGVNCCGVGQTVTYSCTDKCDVSTFAKIPSPTTTPAPTTTTTAPPAPPTQPSYPLQPPGSPSPLVPTMGPCAGGQCLPAPSPQPAYIPGPYSPLPPYQPPQYVEKPGPMLPSPGYEQPGVRPPPQFVPMPAQQAGGGVRILSISDAVDQSGSGGARPLSTNTACPISVFPASVLTELTASSNPNTPDIVLKFTDTCRISECGKICEKAQCNYFVRSSVSGLTNFYTVSIDKLKAPTMVESPSIDSFIPQCAKGVPLDIRQRLTRLSAKAKAKAKS